MNIIDSGYGIVTKYIMKSDTSIQAKGVYAYLCSYAGGGKEAFPSVKRMIEELKIARASIIKYLDELEKAGFIKREKISDNPFNHSNKYILIYEIESSKFEPSVSSEFELSESSKFEPSYTNNNINNNNINKKFTKPTIEEIQEYCTIKNYPINAIKFFNYYESIDWMIGKHKMKNWKAALNTWNQNNKKFNPEQKPINTGKGYICD